MDTLRRESVPPANSESSFGIKKIVDCKIGQDGKQMYKVKWEPTWEPCENLASCQHLIDEFWSFVIKVKSIEQAANQHRKRPRLDVTNNHQNNVINLDADFDQHRMTEDNKADVQRLIARTNATQPGNLMTPSEMLNFPQSNNQNHMMGMPTTPTHNNNQNFMSNSPHMQQQQQTPQQQSMVRPGLPQSPSQVNNKKPNFNSPQQNFGSPGQQNFGSPGQRGKFGAYGNKTGTGMKPEPEESKQTVSVDKQLAQSDLKYLENFDNPYVKLVVVCRVCNKEQSFKYQTTWRRHFLTHSDTKPFKCHLCEKSFIQSFQLRAHCKKKHNIEVANGETKVQVKSEF